MSVSLRPPVRGAGRCCRITTIERIPCSGRSLCAGWFRKRPGRSSRLRRIRCCGRYHVPLRVSVRDKKYDTVSGATVETTMVRPDGRSDVVQLKPDPLEPGTYAGTYTADKPGTYVAETTAHQDKTDLGRDTLTFRREDGVAENFGAAQNRDLLEKLSSDTGGTYYAPGEREAPARRNRRLRSRHHRARQSRPVGHAHPVPARDPDSRRRMAAAPQMGCRVRRTPVWGQGFGPAAELPLGAELYASPSSEPATPPNRTQALVAPAILSPVAFPQPPQERGML